MDEGSVRRSADRSRFSIFTQSIDVFWQLAGWVFRLISVKLRRRRIVPISNLSLDSHTQHGTERLLTGVVVWRTPFWIRVRCVLFCCQITRNICWLELRCTTCGPFLSCSCTGTLIPLIAVSLEMSEIMLRGVDVPRKTRRLLSLSVSKN